MKVSVDNIVQLENSRFRYRAGSLEELMNDIRNNGLLQPIGLRKITTGENYGKYEVVFGNRRLMAVKKLGWKEVDAHVVDLEGTTDMLILNLSENLQRTNLTPFEEGRSFSQLKSMGLTDGEIAARLNIPTTRVKNALMCYSEIPVQYRNKTFNSVARTNKAGRIPASSAAFLVGLKKSYSLSKNETDALFEFAHKKEATKAQLNVVASLISRGVSTHRAIKTSETARVITVKVVLDEKTITKIEHQTKKKIQDILREKLYEQKEFGFFYVGDRHLKALAKTERVATA